MEPDIRNVLEEEATQSHISKRPAHLQALPSGQEWQERRKHGNEIPWYCSGRSSGELFGPLCLETKHHIVMCGVLKLSGIVRANVRLNIAIPMLF